MIFGVFFYARVILGVLALGLAPVVQAAVVVSCTNPAITTLAGGGLNTLNMDCTFSGVTVGQCMTSAAQNKLVPNTVVLRQGMTSLNATLQPIVTSPDSTVVGLIGNASGYSNGLIQANPAKLRFQYQLTTQATTKSGPYTSLANAVTLYWRVRESCTRGPATSGIVGSTMFATVPVATTVTCTSPVVSAAPGGGAYTLFVDCLFNGNPNQIENTSLWTPTSLALRPAGLGSPLTATLANTVLSPDNTVVSLSGNAGAGFGGIVSGLPARIRVRYTGTTMPGTPSGTYTSDPITLHWVTR